MTAGYENVAAVVRLFESASKAPSGHFFYIGFGNLSTNTFTVQPLAPSQDISMAAISVSHACGVVLSAVGRPCDHVCIADVVSESGVGKVWFLEIYRCVFENESPLPHFMPVCVAEPLVGGHCAQLWPVPSNPRGAQGPTCRPLGSSPGSVSSEVIAIADLPQEQCGGPEGDGAEVDLAGDSSIVDVVPPRSGQDDCWAVSDSDEEVLSAPAPPVAAASVPVVRAAVHRPPAAPMPPRMPPRSFVPRREGTEWPKIIYDIGPDGKKAYLRLSTTHGKDFQDIKAFCNVHQGCSAGRNCRDWRPIGRLWWWLSVGHDYSSKELHQRAVPSFSDRCHARDDFCRVPGIEDFLESEKPGHGEEAVTWG